MKKGVFCIVLSALGFAVMAACVRLCDDFGGPVSSFQKSFFRNVVALAIAAIAYAKGRSKTGRTGELNTLESPKSLKSPTRPGRLSMVNRLAIKQSTNREIENQASQETDNPTNRQIEKSINRKTKKAWLLLILRSALGTVGIFANFYALSRISIAEGQTLNKTAPFFTVVFAWLFLKERAGWRTFLSLFVAFAGVVLIAKPGFAGAAALPLAVGLLGGLCAGAAYAALHALRKSAFAPSFVILFFSAFSCLASVPFMLHEFDPMTAAQVAILFGAGAGAALGQFGVTLAYRFAAPRDVAVYDYSNIVFTAALGLLLFNQVPDALAVAGILLVLAAAVLGREKPRLGPPPSGRGPGA